MKAFYFQGKNVNVILVIRVLSETIIDYRGTLKQVFSQFS